MNADIHLKYTHFHNGTLWMTIEIMSAFYSFKNGFPVTNDTCEKVTLNIPLE